MNTARWIEFEGRKYRLEPGQTALDAMLRGGANLLFSCRRGTCRSCMLEVISGDPGEAAQARLPTELRELGFFLPCVADSPTEVVAGLPDLSKWVTPATLVEKTELSEGLFKILLETERQIDWRAGQFISIRTPQNEVRSFSITSIPSDYFIELHIRHFPDGKVSNWLIGDLEIGGRVEFNGPQGTCYYSRDVTEVPLVLVGTGSGSGALLGIARDALEKHHEQQITFYHGAKFESGLYLREELERLERDYPNFTAQCSASRDGEKKRVTDLMLEQNPDLEGTAVFLCGDPDMVEAARIGALRNGVHLSRIFADPFDTPEPYAPRDSAKIKEFEVNPNMWAALDDGTLLTKILTEFYNRAFEDSRLAPFFHKVTKQRLIEKQYAFTRDLLTGTADYFGELPFNSHHWMIISGELFDYRERLFFEVVRQFDVPESIIRQWAGLNETFRREIVKANVRGQMMDGVEHFRKVRVEEVIEVDTVCDGCHDEIKSGETATLHARTGELYCSNCTKE